MLGLLFCLACSAPPPPPKTWNLTDGAIAVTGPPSVDPGGTHEFVVRWKGKPDQELRGEEAPFVVVFGDAEVTTLGGQVPRRRDVEDFRKFSQDAVRFDSTGMCEQKVTLRVGQGRFVPCFSLQKVRDVPLGILLEFHMGTRCQSVEVDARGVGPARPE
ncbi:MAG: hypothetical protein AB1758_06335 [Candidatus Eremiobacterota bacterium]